MTDHPNRSAATEGETEMVYIKRWRTLVRLPKKYAGEIVQALRSGDAAQPSGNINCSRCGGTDAGCYICRDYPHQSLSAANADSGRKRAIELLIKLQVIGDAAVYRLASEAQQMLELPIAAEPQHAREPGFVKPDNDRQVFFYEQDFYVLSNFSAFNVKWGPYTLPTSEHLYHWRRFFLAGHEMADRMCNQIARAPSAHEAFKLAQANKHLQVKDWDDLKVIEMRSILRAKAEQHEYVGRKLLATGDRELIEDSWRDSFWGWGPNRDGQNMLGKLWMEVREELRASPLSRPQQP